MAMKFSPLKASISNNSSAARKELGALKSCKGCISVNLNALLAGLIFVGALRRSTTKFLKPLVICASLLSLPSVREPNSAIKSEILDAFVPASALVRPSFSLTSNSVAALLLEDV